MLLTDKSCFIRERISNARKEDVWINSYSSLSQRNTILGDLGRDSGWLASRTLPVNKTYDLSRVTCWKYILDSFSLFRCPLRGTYVFARWSTITLCYILNAKYPGRWIVCDGVLACSVSYSDQNKLSLLSYGLISPREICILYGWSCHKKPCFRVTSLRHQKSTRGWTNFSFNGMDYKTTPFDVTLRNCIESFADLRAIMQLFIALGLSITMKTSDEDTLGQWFLIFYFPRPTKSSIKSRCRPLHTHSLT